MGKLAIPSGTQWAGLNKRTDPVELSPEQSPDCANVYFYDQKLGLLGPRPGKAYAGAHTYNIWGVAPYNISGQLGSLVAYGDATSTEINLLNLYSVTIPHGGWGDAGRAAPAPAIPAAITRNCGFSTSVTIFTGTSPQSSDVLTTNVNGATFCTATLASASFSSYTSGAIYVFLSFDGVENGTPALHVTVTLSSSGLAVTSTGTLLNITGKLKLTSVRLVAVGGVDPQVGGTIRIAGGAL